MSLVIPPGFGNAAFIFTGAVGTQPYVTTLGVDISGAGGDFVGAANSLMLSYQVAFQTETSNALTLDRVNLAIGQDGPGGSVDSDLSPIAMSRSGTYGPTAMSAIARKVTNEIGRRGRGRMFLPGVITESEVDADGSITSARRGTLQTALNLFQTTLAEPAGEDVAYPPVLLHSQAPADPTPLTSFAVSDLVGWIRGRIR